MTRTILSFLAILALSNVLPAQSAPASLPQVSQAGKLSTGDSTSARKDSVRSHSGSTSTDSIGSTPQPPNVRWKHVTLSAFSSGVYDSNIDRELTSVQPASGFVFGGAIRYQAARIRPRISAGYEVAKHSYTHNDEFDRVSHHFNAVYLQPLSQALLFETIADVGIRGSSEDRDVGNQYIILPRLSYRLPTDQRIRLYGAYRLRRYDVDPGRNAHNRYVGLEIRDEADDGGRWETGFRYETNSARNERRSYTRRTYHTGYTRTIGTADDIYAELKYLSQRYDKRSIEVEDEDVPRHDHRVSPTIEWVHRFGAGFSMIAAYDFEHRTSNDPSNGYRDHIFSLTGRVDW